MPSQSPAPKRPPVAKRGRVGSILKRQGATRKLHATEDKARNHHAMLQRFHLRKTSDQFDYGGAKKVLIDKATGRLKPRFSFRRTMSSWIGAKTRQQALRALTSIITPRSWTATVHGVFVLGVYHFLLIYLPFALSYYPGGSRVTTIVALFLEMFFLVDLLLNLNTAYVQHGVLVTSRTKIARKYLRGWFLFDLLLALPIQALHCLVTHELDHTFPSVRYVQLTLIVLRVLRVSLLEMNVLLARVVHLGKHFSEWARYSRYSHLLGVAQLMWLVLLVAHYMACLWHTVENYDLVEKHTMTIGEQYIADYYYAVSLIQGQGNTTGTWRENLFSSVAIILGSVILAIVFGNVAVLVDNFNANSTNYHRKMEAVFATMEKMDLPLQLRERVNDYHKHVWRQYEALDGNINQFRDELTHTLKIELGLCRHMDLIVQVSFWTDCTPDFLTQIVLSLGVRVYMPNDYVVRRREIGDTMMMINRGCLKLSKPYNNSKNYDENATSNVAIGPVLASQHVSETMDAQREGGREDDSDDLYSDDDPQVAFGGDPFGSQMERRHNSENANLNDFTDIQRFRRICPQRPSYPTGHGPKKPKRYTEYLYPGQSFGEMSLLMNYKRTANIRALTFVEIGQTTRAYENARELYRKKIIPLPWENIIEAISQKRRNTGSEDSSYANVTATMTAAEAAGILVESIDVSIPDDSIKYGFQSFSQEFIEDASLDKANAADSTISSTLQHRYSAQYTRRGSSADSNEKTSELPEAGSNSSSSDRTLNNLLILVQSMANNMERLQQDVNELKRRDHCQCCRDQESPLPSEYTSAASPLYLPVHRAVLPDDTITRFSPLKDDQPALHPRKAFLVAIPHILSPANGDGLRESEKKTSSRYQKSRSYAQGNPCETEEVAGFVIPPKSVRSVQPLTLPQEQEYSSAKDTGSSKAALVKPSQTQTLADALWKRTNHSGDMLKYSEEERNAARRKRQIRSCHSLPADAPVGTQATISPQHHSSLVRQMSVPTYQE